MEESTDSLRHNELNSKTDLLRNSKSVKNLCLKICPSMPTVVSNVVFITSVNVLSSYVYVSHHVKFDKFCYIAPLNSLLSPWASPSQMYQ